METLTLSAGGALFFVGLAEVLGAFDPAQSLNLADPIWGVSFRHLMLTFGVVQVAVSLVLLFTNWRPLGLGLAAWLAANFLIFRIGLVSADWRHSTGFMVGWLGFSPPMMDIIATGLSIFLLAEAGVAFWAGHQKAETTGFLKAICPACGGHVTFPMQNLGQQIVCPHCQVTMTLRSPVETLKMSCVLCGGHVEFPAYAVGRKIPCPHCAKTITLLKLA